VGQTVPTWAEQECHVKANMPMLRPECHVKATMPSPIVRQTVPTPAHNILGNERKHSMMYWEIHPIVGSTGELQSNLPRCTRGNGDVNNMSCRYRWACRLTLGHEHHHRVCRNKWNRKTSSTSTTGSGIPSTSIVRSGTRGCVGSALEAAWYKRSQGRLSARWRH
jgi:hypothetical protein